MRYIPVCFSKFDGKVYNIEKDELHNLLKKLLEKEDKNEKTKGFIFDILT